MGVIGFIASDTHVLYWVYNDIYNPIHFILKSYEIMNNYMQKFLPNKGSCLVPSPISLLDKN